MRKTQRRERTIQLHKKDGEEEEEDKMVQTEKEEK